MSVQEVSELVEVFCEAVVRDLGGLEEALHPLADFDKDVDVLDER